MIDTLLRLLDRMAVTYFSYRAGKSAVILAAQVKLLKDIEDAKKINAINDNYTVEQLLDSLYK